MTGIPKSIFYAALLVSLGFANVTVGAQTDESDDKLWKKLDITQDGWLDGTELKGGWLAFDTDGDKEVTRAEFMAGRAKERNQGGTLEKNPLASPSPQKRELKPVGSTTNLAARAVQPVPAKMTNGKPVGLYYMQKYWIATRYLEKSCWYFAPDGTFYENPTSGFSPHDLAAHKGSKGTYQVSRGKMQVAWSNGSKSEAELELVPGGFNWNTGMFLPVEPIRADKGIVGLYEGGNSLGGGGNSVIVSKTIRLDADGTFAMTGVSSLQSTGEGTQAKAGSQSQVDGRWKLDGFLLSLTNSDGTAARHILIPFYDQANAASPDRLFVGGTIYKRK